MKTSRKGKTTSVFEEIHLRNIQSLKEAKTWAERAEVNKVALAEMRQAEKSIFDNLLHTYMNTGERRARKQLLNYANAIKNDVKEADNLMKDLHGVVATNLQERLIRLRMTGKI